MAKKRGTKKTGATRVSPTRASNWSWGLGGLFIGGGIALFVCLDKLPHTEQVVHTNEAKKNSPTTAPKSQALKQQTDAFDFYSILPGRQINVEQTIHHNTTENTHKSTPIPAPKKAPTIIATHSTPIVKSKNTPPKRVVIVPKNKQKAPPLSLYQLQVGAFTDLFKADALKARLALTGIESNIQVIKSQEKNIYRLRVGPSTDIKNLEQIKKRLKSKNINSFLHKLKNT